LPTWPSHRTTWPRSQASILYQAIWRAGAVVTPATFLLPPEDLRHVIADAEAAAVVTTPEFIDKIRAAAADVRSVRTVICTGSNDEGVTALESLERVDPAPIVDRHDDDLAALLYTGGTTGRAKGVMLSHDNLFFTGSAGHDAGHVPGVNRALMTLPLSHAYGLLVTVVGTRSSRGRQSCCGGSIPELSCR
jgi:long-chain acyl-CoA synthetase